MDRTVGGRAATNCSAGNGWNRRIAEHADLLARPRRASSTVSSTAPRGRAHDDDHAVGVRRAVVVDEAVSAAGPVGELVHDLLDDPGDGEVERVGCLAGLEEDVRVLGGAAHHGRVGRQATGPEREDVVVADQRPDVVVIEDGDLVDLVRGAEAVEEMEERDPRPQRRGMRDQREVVRLLDRARRRASPSRSCARA